MTEEILKNVRDAAAYLDVSEFVIRRHIYQTGKLKPTERTRTGELRFSIAALEQLRPVIGKRGRRKAEVE